MGFWSNLFGSSTVINKAVDGIYNGIDAMVYTDEEKAQDYKERISLKTKMLAAYEPFKIAQRFIALFTGIPFVVIHTILVLTWLVSIYMIGEGEQYKFVFEQLKLVAEWNNTTLGEPFGYIIIFYFLGGAGEGVVRAVRKK